MKSPVEIAGSKSVFNSFDQLKDLLTPTADTLKETTQQAKVSLAETTVDAVNFVTVATDKVVNKIATTAQQGKYLTKTQNAVDKLTAVTSDSINTITAKTEQAKSSLEQLLQTTGQIKNTTTEAIQTAINSSISEWLQAHPVALWLVQMLVWATDHPILSLVILFFSLASTWSLIKAIGSLFERVWLTILQAPFKLGKFLLRSGSHLLSRFSGFTTQDLVGAKNVETLIQTSTSQSSNPESNHTDKQQRLLEISIRLEEIRKEQNELLQEARAIL